MTDLYILDDNDNPIPCPEVLSWEEWWANKTGHKNACALVAQALELN